MAIRARIRELHAPSRLRRSWVPAANLCSSGLRGRKGKLYTYLYIEYLSPAFRMFAVNSALIRITLVLYLYSYAAHRQKRILITHYYVYAAAGEGLIEVWRQGSHLEQQAKNSL